MEFCDTTEVFKHLAVTGLNEALVDFSSILLQQHDQHELRLFALLGLRSEYARRHIPALHPATSGERRSFANVQLCTELYDDECGPRLVGSTQHKQQQPASQPASQPAYQSVSQSARLQSRKSNQEQKTYSASHSTSFQYMHVRRHVNIRGTWQSVFHRPSSTVHRPPSIVHLSCRKAEPKKKKKKKKKKKNQASATPPTA
ncbi:hypothetical protein IWX46DRAFT_126260 [Phyllosticta citricarpa]|uniref:Uncharacterized protein n=1 Tax=Phyllosticta citricarpa TaxID=55181 RepID=A0ABR1M9C5_9PEZI